MLRELFKSDELLSYFAYFLSLKTFHSLIRTNRIILIVISVQDS